ncbi:unnamed protein product [Rotaria magnacalcarata]|uniref:Uncharacterized protein n=1 Tax=Rotaria magnacalcarata TaxID=392030 RepID=A0A818YDE6_9BILA|nr:unnamed protein product [Rotaria magnacalcarata]CAF1949077.1 unnamed protein product [Rotaria magnacalcarata]CAF2104007.1 unnamed protein product [Rotaria magnacalcarata]CAF3751795.1 unnamed protein product [Rotaria magnacalcarata]CAF3893989.1 unnamed protein product [Rotaria magnacalcarata]
MASATSRYPIKPKTLTLLELCRSFHDFRHPPPSLSSYQSQLSPTNAHVLTRRIYLHPLTLTPYSKQQSLKSASNNSLGTLDSDSRHQLNYDRNREIHHVKNKSAFNGLAVLSSSAPIRTRMKIKSDARHSRDKGLVSIEDEINNDFENSSTAFSSNQFSLHSIARGTSSSTHTKCTRPACILNHQKAYLKSNRCDKVDVWHHLAQTLEQPMPADPPTTPFHIISDVNNENDESPNPYLNHNFIQEIKIYKRNPIRELTMEQDTDTDDDTDDYYIYNKN